MALLPLYGPALRSDAGARPDTSSDPAIMDGAEASGRWMRALAEHYESVRRDRPTDNLAVVFDIDGTILDMRHLVHHVLLEFDRAHGTRHFYGLRVEDIRTHENQIQRFLAGTPLHGAERRQVEAWYTEHLWSTEAVLAATVPFPGVLGIIRWFQLQPLTWVALNTGRPNWLRDDTLRSLNELGEKYRVRFDEDLLFMRDEAATASVPESKILGLQDLRDKNLRVVAVVDNEPDNIEAMADADTNGEIVFLHADTISLSPPRETPRTVRGQVYGMSDFVTEKAVPRHVQLVWHGVNDRINLRQFAGSSVQWGECDVRPAPHGRLVLRHDSFQRTPWSRDEELLELDELLHSFARFGKSVKLDLKEPGALIEGVLGAVEQARISWESLWFNGRMDVLGAHVFRTLRDTCPGAVLQCPADFLTPVILTLPERAEETLEELAEWGVNRFSLSWKKRGSRRAFEALDAWGYEVNFYNVPDLESFLEAAVLLPRSLTADFNFPQWHYFGRGAGRGREYHRYDAKDRGAVA